MAHQNSRHSFCPCYGSKGLHQKGEGVLVQQPVYYPFSEVIEDNERKLINSPLILKNCHYEINFADLEEKIVANNVKLMLLCSPHNPVGRVWTCAEL